MSSTEELMRVDAEKHLLVAELDDRQLSESMFGWSDAGLTVRVVRGRKMKNFDGLLNEFSAALQFPWYFGENWSAFQECLQDMDWLPLMPGVVVVITEADEVLSEEPPADLEILVRCMRYAALGYSAAVTDGEWWDRSPVPFHIVLQVRPKTDSALHRWLEAGARPSPLRPALLTPSSEQPSQGPHVPASVSVGPEKRSPH